MSRRRPLVALALVALTCAGCAGSVAGTGVYAAVGPTATSGTVTGTGSTATQTTATQSTTTESTSTDPTSADPTSADPTSADPTSADPTSADPTTAAPPPTTTGAPGELSDEGWVVQSYSFSETFGLFFGTSELTNTAGTPRSAIVTFTLSQDGSVVATMIGSADTVPAGDTVTVDLIGGDEFVPEPYEVAFQVDFTY